jgi:hypothetical protein
MGTKRPACECDSATVGECFDQAGASGVAHRLTAHQPCVGVGSIYGRASCASRPGPAWGRAALASSYSHRI